MNLDTTCLRIDTVCYPMEFKLYTEEVSKRNVESEKEGYEMVLIEVEIFLISRWTLGRLAKLLQWYFVK